MIRIYGGGGTRSLKVAWMAEEMGLDYEIRPVKLFTGVPDEEFDELNPGGFVPAMVDGEVRMIESVAIMEYLAARYGPTPLAPPPESPNFPAYQQYLHYGEASLGGPLAVVLGTRFLAPEEEKQNWGAMAAIETVVRRSAVAARTLKSSPYLAGEAFTAADISVSYVLNLGVFLGFSDRYDPVIGEYLKRVQERPAYKAAVAKSQPKT